MTADAVGGVWGYALDLAANLRSRGVQVILAVMGPPPAADQHADARARGLEVHHTAARLEWMADAWDEVDRAGEWLTALADRCEPDVVHLNGFCHATLPWTVPVVVVGHSCVRTWWRGVHGTEPPPAWDVYSARVAEGLHAADVVITPTRALLECLQGEYGQIARGRVIPNGSSVVNAAVPPSSKEPVVLSAGRLWDEAKNIDAVCAAASAISWRTFVAGDAAGPTGARPPSGAVSYLGRLPARAMAEWYRRAAIYALPARYEPFGLSVVEAAAAGCALVLGDIRTLRENWDGAALFVPPDNRRALARALETLVRDDAGREALAAAASRRARRFTVDAMTEAYLQSYSNLLTPAAAA